jgi:hypothetical protein
MSSNAVMEESVHSWDFSFVISSRSRFAFLLSLPMGGAPPSASEHWTISSGLAIIICFQFSIYKNSSTTVPAQYLIFSGEKIMLLNMDLPKGEQDLSALVKKKPAAAQEEAGVSTKTTVMAPMLIYDPPFSSSPTMHQFNFCFFPFVLHFVASLIMAFSAVFFLPWKEKCVDPGRPSRSELLKFGCRSQGRMKTTKPANLNIIPA